MSYDDYEKQVETTREYNAKLLEGFESQLLDSGLKQKTVKSHVSNVEFYINHYLVYDECIQAKDGIDDLSGFFNWFFPRKAMWSGVSSTKSNVASLKKFYSFLVILEQVDPIDYQILLLTIKNEMPEWLEHYNEADFY